MPRHYTRDEHGRFIKFEPKALWYGDLSKLSFAQGEQTDDQLKVELNLQESAEINGLLGAGSPPPVKPEPDRELFCIAIFVTCILWTGLCLLMGHHMGSRSRDSEVHSLAADLEDNIKVLAGEKENLNVCVTGARKLMGDNEIWRVLFENDEYELKAARRYRARQEAFWRKYGSRIAILGKE